MDEEYRAFCLRDAEWYQKKSEEAKEACEKDPETYYKESLRCAQILCHVLPVIVKKSLESDEYKAAERIYRFQEWWNSFKLPEFRDYWSRASVASLDTFKRFIGVSAKLGENLNQLIGIRFVIYNLSDYIRARM